MEIQTVLETVFLKEQNTTALILNDEVRIMLWENLYMNKQECLDYIKDNMPGWVQTSNNYNDSIKNGNVTGIKFCPITPYEEAFDKLFLYAKDKFNNTFKSK